MILFVIRFSNLLTVPRRWFQHLRGFVFMFFGFHGSIRCISPRIDPLWLYAKAALLANRHLRPQPTSAHLGAYVALKHARHLRDLGYRVEQLRLQSTLPRNLDEGHVTDLLVLRLYCKSPSPARAALLCVLSRRTKRREGHMEVLHVRNQRSRIPRLSRVYRVIDHPPGWRRAVRADGGLL